jgi:dTDP-glucose pyrophosphorylase
MEQAHLAAICLTKDGPLSAAIACIDASGGQIALVVDEAGRLIGTITDGDIRRAILRGASLESAAGDVMNPNPRYVRQATPIPEIVARLRSEQIAQMPILDNDGIVIDIVFADDLQPPDSAGHRAVIMAGGLGTRLRPITETIPKPMIPINGRPILEIIIERFRDQGFRQITLCVNHLAGIIVDHFRDGRDFGVTIDYVHEKKPMGTAGALSLISPRPAKPMIVMNGDILTSVNFTNLLSFHYDNLALATMALNKYQYKLPYGVVDVRDHHIKGFKEKPVLDFFVNAGIYVISPEAIDLVPSDCMFDMPSLFEKIPSGRRVAFPIHEYWLDIGRHDDLDRALQEYTEHFPDVAFGSAK